MEIITIAMLKGGTGKTTTALTLAQAAAYKKKRVLLIDLDPQGDLSFAAGANTKLQGTYELINGAPAEDTIQTVFNNIDIISGHEDLAALETEKNSFYRLKNALEPIKDNYDLAIIDTSPTKSEARSNAIMAATSAIIPLQADSLCLAKLHGTIADLRKINDQINIKGIIFTENSERTTLAAQTQDSAINEAAEKGVNYLGDVRKCVSVKEAQALQRNLYDYKPKCTAAEDYLSILRRILKGIK